MSTMYEVILRKTGHPDCTLYSGADLDKAKKAFMYSKRVIVSALPYVHTKGWSIRTIKNEMVRSATVEEYHGID